MKDRHSHRRRPPTSQNPFCGDVVPRWFTCEGCGFEEGVVVPWPLPACPDCGLPTAIRCGVCGYANDPAFALREE